MNPEDCPHERTTITFGRRLKTCCTLKEREIWVECRQWGECHWAGYDGEPDDTEPEQDECECEPDESEREPTDSETEQLRLFE